MMKRYDFVVVLCLVSPLFNAGCVASPEDVDDDIGIARSPALGANALGANALGANALGANALGANALSPTMLNGSALATGSLSATALSAIQDPGSTGTLSRELLRYTVSCAFTPSQSVSFSWVDSSNLTHDETYSGLIGLAPTWANEALSVDGQRWVSACLIARVNHFGISVMLSMRGGASALDTTTEERAAYTYLEGAFWGNVFSATPTAYACDYVPNDAHSRSGNRVCAAGYDDGSGTLQSCGIIQRLGSCATACGDLVGGQYYASCSSGGGQSSSSVITVFLE